MVEIEDPIIILIVIQKVILIECYHLFFALQVLEGNFEMCEQLIERACEGGYMEHYFMDYVKSRVVFSGQETQTEE